MSNKVCLLIEDSKIQANLIMQMIAKTGWSVFTALNLEQGLKTLKSQGIDLVLTDLILPDSDGLNTVAKIREASPKSVIAAMTAGDTKKNANDILKSAKAQGAEFLLQKPFDFNRLKEMLSEAENRIDNGSNAPLALIVDDASTIRSICEKMLKQNGFRTVCAASLDEAFDEIDNFDLSVILTDLNMPGISPFEAIPTIREAMPGVGIVVMTGEAEGELNNALLVGADTVITKPFKAEVLAQTLRKAMIIASSNLLENMNK